MYSGQSTYEGTRPWLERTQWISTYQGVPRDILKRLMLLPAMSSTKHGLQLGFFKGRALTSSAADEERIYHLISALDPMLDRCEETMRRTGHPLLAWLKSHAISEPSPRPFSFLGTQQARSRYRRTWKQFITFALRVFRLGPVVSQEILHLVLQPPHYQQLEQSGIIQAKMPWEDPPFTQELRWKYLVYKHLRSPLVTAVRVNSKSKRMLVLLEVTKIRITLSLKTTLHHMEVMMN
ncbi:hypothetical protein CNMCM6106_007708 [Aspergillus hiratsukae]|uniref:Uncharacterized protein n=1 Tax=Aspergillus hiratsukae TaxID=1194566 RepID=A0A8H6V0M0_9EURO|nr:hypothetical protein CNMCM6106_007708 [Aspergillus hiratsukae]